MNFLSGRHYKILTSAAAMAILAIAFQNCAQGKLEAIPSTYIPSILVGSGAACLSGTVNGNNLSNYTVDSFYVSNLNLIFYNGGYLTDTDADGIPDKLEKNYGFNYLNRHSSNNLLDSICLNLSGSNSCAAAVPPSCLNFPNMLGLTQCDYQALALQLVNDHPDMGIDSDSDGIPDILEILRGTRPNVNDIDDDPDHDLVINRNEIVRGTSPFFAETSPDPLFLTQSSAAKTTSPSCVAGEYWTFNIARVPLVELDAYSDLLESRIPAGGLSLSHGKNENVVVAFLKLKPKASFPGNSVVLFKRFNPNTSAKENSVTFNLSDFVKAGEVK